LGEMETFYSSANESKAMRIVWKVHDVLCNSLVKQGRTSTADRFDDRQNDRNDDDLFSESDSEAVKWLVVYALRFENKKLAKSIASAWLEALERDALRAESTDELYALSVVAAQREHVASAFEELSEAQDLVLSPELCIGLCACLCRRNGNLALVEQAVLSSSSASPTAYRSALAFAIDRFARASDIERVLSLVGELRRRHNRLDNVVALEAARVLADAGRFDDADTLLAECFDASAPFNVHHAAHAIAGLVRGRVARGDVDGAKRLLDTVFGGADVAHAYVAHACERISRRVRNIRGRAQSSSQEAAFDACTHDLKAALLFFDASSSSAAAPIDGAVLATMVDACAALDHHDGVERFYALARDTHSLNDATLALAFTKARAQRARNADDLWRVATELVDNVEPDSRLVTAVLSSPAARADVDFTRRFFEHYCAGDEPLLRADGFVLCALVHTYATRREFARAERALASLLDVGTSNSVGIGVCSLLKAYCALDDSHADVDRLARVLHQRQVRIKSRQLRLDVAKRLKEYERLQNSRSR
jgi:hypothetical protein